MGDLKTENTGYPAALDTATLIADVTDEAVAAHVNGPVSAIIALETELGIDVAGSVATLATRLGVNIHADGGLLRGTSFPGSPPAKPHLFWRSDEKKFYIYDSAIAQYQRIDSVTDHGTLTGLADDDHTNYVHISTARTITAQHTFSPGTAIPPFVLGANAIGQKVIGLDAETVDGKNPGSAWGLATLDVNSLVVQDPANAFYASTPYKIVKRDASGNITGKQLISDIADGTAPLVVTSTTVVANLKAATATQVTDGTNNIRTKVMNIGDWDMDATASILVAHGLDSTKITSVLASVVTDSNSTLNRYMLTPGVNNGAELDGYIDYWNSTHVQLARKGGGDYDNVGFNETSYNRGYITIFYIV